jgi:hypothetical protein
MSGARDSFVCLAQKVESALKNLVTL